MKVIFLPSMRAHVLALPESQSLQRNFSKAERYQGPWRMTGLPVYLQLMLPGAFFKLIPSKSPSRPSPIAFSV